MPLKFAGVLVPPPHQIQTASKVRLNPAEVGALGFGASVLSYIFTLGLPPEEGKDAAKKPRGWRRRDCPPDLPGMAHAMGWGCVCV